MATPAVRVHRALNIVGGQSHRNRTPFGTYKLTLITEHQQQSPQGSAPAAVKLTSYDSIPILASDH